MEFLYFLTISITAGLCTAESWSDTEDNICPKLYPKKFLNYSPIGNITAGNYTNNEEIKGLKNCVRACCLADSCNVVFIYNEVCYHIECVSNELCLPLLRTDLGLKEQMSMILVKPVLSDDSWSDILNQANYLQFSNMLPEVPEDISSYAYPSQQNRILNSDDIFPLRYQNNYPNLEDRINNNKYVESDLMMDATSLLDKVACNIGNNDCPINYVCVPFNLQTRNGICKCRKGTQENSQGECVERPFSKGPTDLDGFIKKDDLLTMDPQAGQNLTVEVLSKEIRLPDNEVTLSAYTIPEASNNNYSYAWTLVDQPKDHFTGNMKQNGATVTLTDLKEGQYRFKVIVKGTNSYGEDYANVTVLPATRVNKPPQAVVQPQKQTVKLPVAMVVLDGSSSTDDTNIISYHWDLTSGPLGYQLGVQDGQILKLNDLKQPGNYTFKLTVQDSDLAKNSTTANITVLNHTDYPPEANAGQDVILYLPNNNLTLNGSLSTDDHEITSWEWTKAAEDENKAVDMQNTHSPYLQLSNLSEGMYKFVLKVTDSSGQSSTAEVHVFVKPPTNTPPVANAGADMQISLPQTWVVLNGSASHDDHSIVSFNWQCTSGPNNATIEQSNSSIANATGLTKGQYEFQLVVVDDNGNRGTDTVMVTVEQNKNSPPKANAGGDQVLVLPVPVLILNGSKSSDDFRIRSYKWTRASVGLAAGTIIFESDTKPVLMLTNIEAGRYVFELTVTDDQGETDHDTVSVQIKANPIEDKLIEITLNTPVSSFTQNQLDSLVQKINLLMKEGIQINVTEIRGQIDTGNTQIIAFLASKDAPLPATESLKMLRVSSASLGLTLRSVGCVSRCSGRGHCDKATRSCRCNAFWMQSLFNQWTSEEPDCDWSVVYASIGGVLIMCLLCGACSMCSRLLRRIGGCQYKPKSTYKLVPLADREDQPFAVKNISESDSDSDVQIFESTKISSFTTRTSNGDVRPKKNGHYKPIRKVRT